MSDQPDGCYPRVTGEQVLSGQFNDSLVSLVGQMKDIVEGPDGAEFMAFEACDKTIINCTISPDISFESGKFCEIIGAASGRTNEEGALDAFVCRELGSDFDLSLYHDLVTKVLNIGGKFEKYFYPKDVMG